MNICVDLDGVLIVPQAIDVAAKELGYNFGEKDAVSWNFHTFPENLRQLIFKYFYSEEVMCNNIKIIPGAQDKIKSWSNFGHKIYVITARASVLEKATRELVLDYFPQVNDIFFVDITGSKLNKLKELKCDIFFDDAPHNIIEAREAGIESVLISNKYTPFNHHLRNTGKWTKCIAEVNL